MNELCSESAFVSPTMLVSLGTEQTQTTKKTFLILQYSTLKSTVAGIQGLAPSEQGRRVTEGRRGRQRETAELKAHQQ